MILYLKFIIRIAVLLLLSHNLLAREKQDDLLRLSILPLMDKVGSVGYRYLSQSISITIDRRLKKIFEYQPYKNSKAQSYLKNLLKKERKKWTDIKEPHLLRLTQDKNIDVVVYGEYKGSEFDKRGDITKMLIRIGVFLSAENKTYWVDDEISLDTSLFTVIEEIADDLVIEISELLSGKKSFKEEQAFGRSALDWFGNEKRKALIRFRKHKNDSTNNLLEDEMEDFSDYMEDKHNIKFLSFADFKDDYVDEKHKSKDANISNKKTLLKWMRYFNIPNLVELRATKRGEIFITLIAIDQGQREKKYKPDIVEEKKEKVWNRLARGFRGDIPKKEQIGEKRKVKRSLSKKKLKEKSKSSLPEIGARLGYLYPILLGDFPGNQLGSAGGFLIEAYYSQPLSYFDFLSDYSDLPELYTFTAFERYEIDSAVGGASIAAARVAVAFGLLYPYHFGKGHSLKGGFAMGLAYRSITVEGISSSSDVLLNTNILFGFGFLHKDINFSVFSRISFIPGRNINVFGFSLNFGAGYLIH